MCKCLFCQALGLEPHVACLISQVQHCGSRWRESEDRGTEEKHLTTGRRWRDMVCHVSQKCEWPKKKRKHRRSCTEFSEFNSISTESLDSEQHNEGSQETKGTGRARTNNRAPEEDIGRCLSSSVRPVVFPPYIESRMVVLNVFSLSRERFFPVATVLWSILSTQISAWQPITLFLSVHPSRCPWKSTDHHVLDCGATADFQSFFGLRGSFSASMPKSSFARVRRVLVSHTTWHETSMLRFVHSTRHLHWTDVGLFTSKHEGAAALQFRAAVHSREHP